MTKVKELLMEELFTTCRRAGGRVSGARFTKGLRRRCDQEKKSRCPTHSRCSGKYPEWKQQHRTDQFKNQFNT
jgi:hypothetical protein